MKINKYLIKMMLHLCIIAYLISGLYYVFHIMLENTLNHTERTSSVNRFHQEVFPESCMAE